MQAAPLPSVEILSLLWAQESEDDGDVATHGPSLTLEDARAFAAVAGAESLDRMTKALGRKDLPLTRADAKDIGKTRWDAAVDAGLSSIALPGGRFVTLVRDDTRHVFFVQSRDSGQVLAVTAEATPQALKDLYEPVIDPLLALELDLPWT